MKTAKLQVWFFLRVPLAFILLFHSFCKPVEKSQETQNLRAFAKLYGYTRYFHPTVPAKRTIQGVREGRDEFLEKALEVIKQ